jgi:glycine betaine/choline ABC-type transport system substrate-binding protein
MVVAALALGGCSTTPSVAPESRALTIGAQSGLDNQVLAAVYGTALEEQGFSIDYNWGVGSRKRILAGLQDGLIDIVPDYVGLALTATDPEKAVGTDEALFGALDSAVAEIGLTALQPAPGQKADVFVVTRDFAELHDIDDLSDLADLGAALTIGSREALDGTDHGRRALEYSYGISGWTARVGGDDESVLENLRSGSIQVACVSSLTRSLYSDDVVGLGDPRGIVLNQNVVPLVNSAYADATIQRTLDAVSARITDSELASFAASQDALPTHTARTWLEKQGLIEPNAD